MCVNDGLIDEQFEILSVRKRSLVSSLSSIAFFLAQVYQETSVSLSLSLRTIFIPSCYSYNLSLVIIF